MWMGPLSTTSITGLIELPGLGTVEPVQLLEMGDEVAAALVGLVCTIVDACGIERAEHRDLLGLSRRWNAQVCDALGPSAGETRMRQRLALVAVEQNDVAGVGRCLRSCRRRPSRSTSSATWRPSACAGPPPAEGVFRRALDNSERLMRHAIARFDVGVQPRNRPVGRSATGSASSGMALATPPRSSPAPGRRDAASSASTPPRMQSLRHSRTVSSRTPNVRRSS